MKTRRASCNNGANRPYRFACILALVLAPAWAHAAPADGVSADGLEFFETKIRPLLARNCHGCHGPDKQKAGLRLDSRAALLAGGKSGPAIVPGQPAASLLVDAIHYAGPEMPPSGKLSEREIAAVTRWIEIGAPWPDRPAAARQARDDAYWAFQPIRRPEVPWPAAGEAAAGAATAATAIDAFLQARLDEVAIAPAAPADRRTLIRRACFDLTGLPPTPEEVDAFVTDDAPDAFARVIDDLLARPQFGERWGRHWLDVVRFGQTNGYERDDEKVEAWRFRDYVIQSFNDDKPIDRFILEQLAGDELADVSHDSIIATGFYRIGVWDDEPAEKTLARHDELDDIVRVTGAAFLGLTVGCARCHDHMFDPLSQQDYYQFLAFFQNVAPYGRDKDGNSETHWEANPDAIYTPLASPAALARWQQTQRRKQARIAQLDEQIAGLGDDESGQTRKKQLREQRDDLQESLDEAPYELALSVREPAAQPAPTYLLVRGDPRQRGPQVTPAAPAVLAAVHSSGTPAAVADDVQPLRRALIESGVSPTSGRRLAVARWIASRDNPLTARVFANRVWQHLLGRGIVRTPNNFGRAGTPPTHPRLLDWLAAELVDGGWRIKPLIKTIMLSHAYQQSSRSGHAAAVDVDPANDLFWRQNLRRLDAEAVRDSMLAVSGRLNLTMGGRGFFPELSADVLATQSKPGHNWGSSSLDERHRRSVYIFVKRTLMVPMLEAFDYTNTAEPLGVRPVTTVAPQALLLLNDAFVERQADEFARRVAREAPAEQDARIARAFQLGLGRLPDEREATIARRLLNQHRQRNSGEHAALASLCLVIFNLNEFIYVD